MTPNRRQRDSLGILALVAAAALVVALSWFEIGNLDLGYHIAYGRHFLETGKIVGFAPDPNLYSETGIPFVNANWGSQIVLASVERIAGGSGLFSLRLILIAIIFLSLGWVCHRRTKSLAATSIAVVIGAMAAYERFSLRPELFSYAILAVQLAVLNSRMSPRQRIVSLVVLQLMLVNVHSYFLLGIALTMCCFGSAMIEYLRNRSAESKKVLSAIGVALALQVVACFAHPWHVDAALFPVRTIGYLAEHNAMGAGDEGSTSAWGQISEFQSPFSFLGQPINRFTIYAFIALVAMGLAGTIGALVRKQWVTAFAIVGFLIVAMQMRRNIAPFAIVVAPLAVAELYHLCARFGSLKETALFGHRMRQGLRIVTTIATVALIFLVSTGRWYYAERRITRQSGMGYNDVTFPRRSVEWLANQSGIKPRIYVDYFASSNALLWLPDAWKLYVDTNTFAYTEPTLAKAFTVELGESPHDEFFDTYGINVVLLRCGPNTQRLVKHLADDDLDWSLVYLDSSHVIFLRRAVWEHADIILENPVSETRFEPKIWIYAAEGSRYKRALAIGTMANVPLALGWWSEASVLCREAVKFAPDYGEMWFQLGICHVNIGKSAARSMNLTDAIAEWREAEKCLDRASELSDPDGQVTALLNQVRALVADLSRINR